jgi:hypothetical protein
MVVSARIARKTVGEARRWGGHYQRFWCDDRRQTLVVADSLVAQQDLNVQPDCYERLDID